MEKAKQQVKIFAIFYGFLGILNILAMIIGGTLSYMFATILAFVFALTLYRTSQDITKYSYALIIAIIELVVVGYEVIGLLINGVGLFYVASSIIELILVVYAISLLNMFRKEVKEEKKEK